MAAVTVGASKYGGQERTLEAIHSCALVLGMTVVGNSSELSNGHFGISAQRPAESDEYAKKGNRESDRADFLNIWENKFGRNLKNGLCQNQELNV